MIRFHNKKRGNRQKPSTNLHGVDGEGADVVRVGLERVHLLHRVVVEYADLHVVLLFVKREKTSQQMYPSPACASALPSQ